MRGGSAVGTPLTGPLLLPAEATLLRRIAAARRGAGAMLARARLRGTDLATALAAFASAGGAGAVIFHFVVHRKTPSWLVGLTDIGHPTRRLCSRTAGVD